MTPPCSQSRRRPADPRRDLIFPAGPKHTSVSTGGSVSGRNTLTPLLEQHVATTSEGRDDPTHAMLAESEQSAVVSARRELTDSMFEELDVEHEIRATDAQGPGETVLLHDDSKLSGFAVCPRGL